MTPRQRQALAFIAQFIESNGYPPTIREIGFGLGLSSSSTVHRHLQLLERSGRLWRDHTKPRAMRLLP